jgi:hypothetical protein
MTQTKTRRPLTWANLTDREKAGPAPRRAREFSRRRRGAPRWSGAVGDPHKQPRVGRQWADDVRGHTSQQFAFHRLCRTVRRGSLARRSSSLSPHAASPHAGQRPGGPQGHLCGCRVGGRVRLRQHLGGGTPGGAAPAGTRLARRDQPRPQDSRRWGGNPRRRVQGTGITDGGGTGSSQIASLRAGLRTVPPIAVA